MVLQQQLTLLVTATYEKRGQTCCVQVKIARRALQDAKKEAKRCLPSSAFAVVVKQGNTKGVLGAS